MRNNPSLGVVNINAYVKFGSNPSIHFKVIGQKQNSDINQGP